jgi:hypothetical protein
MTAQQFMGYNHFVSDPDPHRSALIFVGWIWIRIQESKIDPQKRRKKKLEISCFEVLDVLFGGLKAFLVAWMSFIES